jgi:hypothetical protein
MATYQKRHGRWRVRIQRQGMKAESFTADTKGECQFWAKRRETELDRLALMSTLPALPAPLPVIVSARPCNRTIRNEDELKRLLSACAEYGRRRRKPDTSGASLFHAVSFARLSALRRSELIGFCL